MTKHKTKRPNFKLDKPIPRKKTKVYTKIEQVGSERYEVVYRATGSRAHKEIQRRKLPSREDVLADRKKVVGT